MPVGVVVKPVVTAVKVCPKTAVPLMVTVPPSVALSVVMLADAGLLDEACSVAVSFIRATNV